MTQPLIAPNANDPREDGPSAGELSAKDRRIAERVEVLMADPEFWIGCIEGENPLCFTIPYQLCRAVQNLDVAIKGEHYSREGLYAALSLIQRDAKARARKQAEGEME